MPVDYSKWDALELSDDSDIEVHPNVDKRSFIRAKQNQIHMERQQRRHHIETLKYERIINDELAARIQSLLDKLRAHEDEARSATNPNAAGEVAFRAVMESTMESKNNDKLPERPPGVHANVEQPDSYTKMMAALLDQVNKEMADRKLEGPARYDAMVKEIEGHKKKVTDLQAELIEKLNELEHEESRKITSDGIHTGFDSSHVNKDKLEPAEKAAAPDSGGKTELLNPNFTGSATAAGGGGAAAAITLPPSTQSTKSAGNGGDDDDDVSDASPLARKFAAIPVGNHRESMTFLASHPEILTDKEEEGILVLAFNAGLEGKEDEAHRLVHQSHLIKYCRALGRDGVPLFFKRITTADHQARDVFYKDVQETFAHIRSRTREINSQRKVVDENGEEGIEQIQLHAVEPGTVINIRIPPANDPNPEVQAARKVFEGFKPEMRKALESGELDKVNLVLGAMKVDDAEALVGEFGEAGILSMEEEILDATTAEGRAHLKELGRENMKEDLEQGKQEPATASAAVDEFPDPE